MVLDRRRFLALAALGLAGMAGGIAGALYLGRPRAMHLARDPASGFWGLTPEAGSAGGSLAPGPGGLLGIAHGHRAPVRLHRGEDGVTHILR
jgi:hypothetical protein